jgi:2-keto-4-pentenoate hydratase/2-oxohepta-3-ene-1,7-dioic acid hydratase in catechol pathway
MPLECPEGSGQPNVSSFAPYSIVHFEKAGVPGIAADDGSGWHGLTARESGFPGTLPELIAQGADLQPGDIFEVEIEGMGVLSNPVQDE